MTSRTTTWLCALPLLGLCACAGTTTRALPRRALAPATAVAPAALASHRQLVEAAERAAPPTRTPGSPAPPNPARPGVLIYRSFAERTDAAAGGVDEAPAQQISYGANPYDIYGAPPPTRRRGAPTSFPVNTAIGAGVGAVLGHQRGRRDEGALWGAGIGLLFDLARWSR